MRVVELSDEENLAILAETFVESLEALDDRTREIAVLKRICELLESSAPRHYVYESLAGCEDLQVIRVGDDRRVFCRLVCGIPESDPRYNVLFAFYVDCHDYRRQQLHRFDVAAKERLAEIAALSDISSVDDYLADMDAFAAEEIRERIDRFEG